MAKNVKTAFFCSECGNEFSKWFGQCPSCKAYNTLVEEPVSSAKPYGKNLKPVGKLSKPTRINEITAGDEERFSTGFGELDRVLGGGIVIGGLVLVGGDPGIGKSTLLLQVCRNVAGGGRKVLYISGEESLRQIKLRANRMGEFSDNLMLLSETDLDVIESTILNEKPQLVIIDSIQTMFREDISSAPGSVSQVRETTNSLMQLAKNENIPVFIVGHVTKEGVVAGPRVLEHMVDTVLYFEGDRYASYRILRGVKNRFGSTNEIGVFEMKNDGLSEVLNPSQYMLDGRPENASGSVVSCLMEGTRPVLVEIQALVIRSGFGMPRRTTVGIDYNRVNMLMAVIEKQTGMQLSDFDAYVNVAGGMKINEPAIDLAIIVALLSGYENNPIGPDTVVFGEVGLSGEIRAVSQIEQRVLEAKKMGFSSCVIPAVSLPQLKNISGIKLIGISNVKEMIGNKK